MVRQKVTKSYFLIQFSTSKIDGIFSKKNNFFQTLIFEPLYFLKIMPYFWQSGAPCILKIQWFPLSIFIFGFLGPTIFKIPQPNWY
jgi:hypothetical protein